MREFLIRFVAFVLVAVLIGLAVDRLISRPLLRSPDLEQLDAQFRARVPEIDFLVLGDSQAGSAWETDFSTGFNFSFGGQAPIHSFSILSTLIDDLASLEVLVIQADPHSYSSKRLDDLGPPTLWRPYVDYLSLARDFRRPDLVIDWVRAHMFSFVGESLRLRQGLADWRAGRNAEPEAGEPGPPETEPRFGRFDAAERLRQGRGQAEFLIGDDLIAGDMSHAWARLARLADAHGVRVIAVSYPLSGALIQGFGPERITAADAVTADLVERYPVEAWLNYREIFAERPELFRDSNHLNADGRLEFARRITEDLKGLGAIKPAHVDALIQPR